MMRSLPSAEESSKTEDGVNRRRPRHQIGQTGAHHSATTSQPPEATTSCPPQSCQIHQSLQSARASSRETHQGGQGIALARKQPTLTTSMMYLQTRRTTGTEGGARHWFAPRAPASRPYLTDHPQTPSASMQTEAPCHRWSFLVKMTNGKP